MPGTPFGRRLSFGARALRDVSGGARNGGGGAGGGGGGSPGQNGIRSPTAASAANKTPPTSNKQTGTISSRTADAKGRGLSFALPLPPLPPLSHLLLLQVLVLLPSKHMLTYRLSLQ